MTLKENLLAVGMMWRSADSLKNKFEGLISLQKIINSRPSDEVDLVKFEEFEWRKVEE